MNTESDWPKRQARAVSGRRGMRKFRLLFGSTGSRLRVEAGVSAFWAGGDPPGLLCAISNPAGAGGFLPGSIVATWASHFRSDGLGGGLALADPAPRRWRSRIPTTVFSQAPFALRFEDGVPNVPAHRRSERWRSCTCRMDRDCMAQSSSCLALPSCFLVLAQNFLELSLKCKWHEKELSRDRMELTLF